MKECEGKAADSLTVFAISVQSNLLDTVLLCFHN